MHTARLLTVSPGMHCAGGCLPLGVGGQLPGGGVCLPGGRYLLGGVPAPEGEGGGIPACTEADPPCEQNS